MKKFKYPLANWSFKGFLSRLILVFILLSCSTQESVTIPTRIKVTLYHNGEKIRVYTEVRYYNRANSVNNWLEISLKNGQRVYWNGDFLIEKQ